MKPTLRNCLIAAPIVLICALLAAPYFMTRPLSKKELLELKVDIGGDALDQRMRSLVASGIDCGRSTVGSDVRPQSDCVLKAFQDKKSFRVRYDLQGIDSDVSVGLVGTNEGTVMALLFDGDPQGQTGTSEARQRVSETMCPPPVKLFKSPTGRVTCFSVDPKSQKNVMAPTFGSY